MTTELDDDLVPETLALINEFGLPASFTVDGGTFDDATSTWNPSVSVIVRKVTPPSLIRRQIEGVLTEVTTSYVAAKDLPFLPRVGMLVTIAGRDFKLTRANAILSGELVCLYELGLD